MHNEIIDHAAGKYHNMCENSVKKDQRIEMLSNMQFTKKSEATHEKTYRRDATLMCTINS